MVQAILVIFFFISVAISFLSGSAVSDLLQKKEEDRITYCKEIANKINYWYQNNAFEIDSIDSTVTPPFTVNYRGGTILSSRRLDCHNGVKGHIFVVAIPTLEDLKTTIDPDTGEIKKGPYDVVEVVNGCEIEKRLFEESDKKAKNIAAWLESYYKAKNLSDAYGHKNYFTSNSCGGWGDIPCTTNSSAKILKEYIGGHDEDFITAYNKEMIFDNSSKHVNSNIPPYSCRVGFILPWGDTKWTIATEQT